MLTEEQISAMVKAKYPVSHKERNCRQEQEIMKGKREWYAEQLRAGKAEAPTLN